MDSLSWERTWGHAETGMRAGLLFCGRGVSPEIRTPKRGYWLSHCLLICVPNPWMCFVFGEMRKQTLKQDLSPNDEAERLKDNPTAKATLPPVQGKQRGRNTFTKRCLLRHCCSNGKWWLRAARCRSFIMPCSVFWCGLFSLIENSYHF